MSAVIHVTHFWLSSFPVCPRNHSTPNYCSTHECFSSQSLFILQHSVFKFHRTIKLITILSAPSVSSHTIYRTKENHTYWSSFKLLFFFHTLYGFNFTAPWSIKKNVRRIYFIGYLNQFPNSGICNCKLKLPDQHKTISVKNRCSLFCKWEIKLKSSPSNRGLKTDS